MNAVFRAERKVSVLFDAEFVTFGFDERLTIRPASLVSEHTERVVLSQVMKDRKAVEVAAFVSQHDVVVSRAAVIDVSELRSSPMDSVLAGCVAQKTAVSDGDFAFA